jgi:2-polyprenyl-3-methyl-5-hydroxy-6-metoxy-1,4-benzoquinol methylase
MSDVASTAPQASAYYDASYFAWQRQMAEFGAWSNIDKYRDTVGPNDRVLDFGCGGGFLLAKLDCAERIGVEPNPAAR